MKKLEKKVKKIIDRLLEYKSIQLVRECLTIVKNEDIYFEDNDLLHREVVKENYLDKHIIQKNIIGQEKVIGYSALLKNLYECNEEYIHLFTIAVSDSTFIIFFNEKIDCLIGILRTYAQTKEDLEKLNIEYKKKGLNVYGVSIKL